MRCVIVSLLGLGLLASAALAQAPAVPSTAVPAVDKAKAAAADRRAICDAAKAANCGAQPARHVHHHYRYAIYSYPPTYVLDGRYYFYYPGKSYRLEQQSQASVGRRQY